MDDSVGNGLENPAENRGLLWRALGISLIGYAADYYDFGLYATVAALVFPRLFFPNSDPTTALLASFGTFTAGFVTRPLGGVIFGQLGDRIGRKKVFVFGMVVIGLVTTAIGLLPTFATIGILAPTLLVLLRMVQGIAVGGQFGAAALVTTEYAPNDKRGFYSSLAQIGAPLSDVLVNLSFLALTVALTQDQFLGWGWRVPFLLGFIPVLVGLYAHKRLEETPVFRQARRNWPESRERWPILNLLRAHPWQTVSGIGMTIGYLGSVYVLLSYMLAYGTATLGLSRGTMLGAVLISEVVAMPLTIAFAALSDRVGRRKVYATGAVLAATWAFPFFWFVNTAAVVFVFGAMLISQAFVRMMHGPLTALLVEMFGTEVRFSGVSVSFQFGSLFGASLAPLISAWLFAATGTSLAVSGYVAAVALVGLISASLAVEASDRDLLEVGG